MRKAGDIVSALFKEKYGPEFMETARSSAGLFSSWSRIVAEAWPRPFGSEQSKDDIPAAAVHSRIRELERGLLLVEADHPGWVQILQTKQAELLSSVQRQYPKLDITGIVFKLSREPVSSIAGDALSPEKKSPKEQENAAPLPPPSNEQPRKAPGKMDKELFTALKYLEKSVKERNKTV